MPGPVPEDGNRETSGRPGRKTLVAGASLVIVAQVYEWPVTPPTPERHLIR